MTNNHPGSLKPRIRASMELMMDNIRDDAARMRPNAHAAHIVSHYWSGPVPPEGRSVLWYIMRTTLYGWLSRPRLHNVGVCL